MGLYQYCCHIKIFLLRILTQMEISIQSTCNGTCKNLSCTVQLIFMNYLYTNMSRINTREISDQCHIIITHTGDQSYQCSNGQMILMSLQITSIECKSYHFNQHILFSTFVDILLANIFLRIWLLFKFLWI